MDIPSVDLSERLLSDICDLINEQMKEKTDRETPRVTYEVKEKVRSFETGDSEEFVRHALSKEFGWLRIWYYFDKRRIRIDINSSKYSDSDFSVEGENRTWVDGITKRLEEIFRKYKTNNDLFHKRWRNALPIYIGLGILTGVSAFLVLQTLRPIDSEGNDNLATWMVVGGGMGIGSLYVLWYNLLGWLFPKVETEFTPQRHYRKKLLAVVSFIFGTIILGLVVNYLSTSFFNP